MAWRNLPPSLVTTCHLPRCELVALASQSLFLRRVRALTMGSLYSLAGNIKRILKYYGVQVVSTFLFVLIIAFFIYFYFFFFCIFVVVVSFFFFFFFLFLFLLLFGFRCLFMFFHENVCRRYKRWIGLSFSSMREIENKRTRTIRVP